MEDINRIPPHSVESEQSILGSIILDKDAIITVAETINPSDFYKEAHKIIYESMLSLNSNNEPIDLITLIEELRKEGHLDNIGGISYLTSLSTIVPTTSNVKYYANIVKEKLKQVGLLDKIKSMPLQLSGGQQQRVAIARSLVNNPKLIFADEPTGALDSETSNEIMSLLKDLNNQGKTIIMVTHDADLIKYATKVVRLKDGVLYEEAYNEYN